MIKMNKKKKMSLSKDRVLKIYYNMIKKKMLKNQKRPLTLISQYYIKLQKTHQQVKKKITTEKYNSNLLKEQKDC